jgi:predicted dithiol-disulfide oxidoreductase (DUF899 family)
LAFNYAYCLSRCYPCRCWHSRIHRSPHRISAFALENGVIYHTYSTYARGVDPFFGIYHWLDRAHKGRNETGLWFRRHDEYDKH